MSKKADPIKDRFKDKVDTAMARIQTADDFRESDKYINYVFEVGEWLFSEKLDTMAVQSLIRTGGRLNGVYAYLGNRYATARAERDVYEQKRDEVLNELTTEKYKENDSKVTLARAEAKLEIAQLDDLVTVKEHEKNNYENLLSATDRMISFIQSSIKVKEAERFRSGAMQDNR